MNAKPVNPPRKSHHGDRRRSRCPLGRARGRALRGGALEQQPLVLHRPTVVRCISSPVLRTTCQAEPRLERWMLSLRSARMAHASTATFAGITSTAARSYWKDRRPGAHRPAVHRPSQALSPRLLSCTTPTSSPRACAHRRPGRDHPSARGEQGVVYIQNPTSCRTATSSSESNAHRPEAPRASAPTMLRPGSVLYMPRGFAHEARSTDEGGSCTSRSPSKHRPVLEHLRARRVCRAPPAP